MLCNLRIKWFMFHLLKKKNSAEASFYCLKRDYIKKCATECIYQLEKGSPFIWVAFLSVSVSFSHCVLYKFVNIRNIISDISLGRDVEGWTLLPLHISGRLGMFSLYQGRCSQNVQSLLNKLTNRNCWKQSRYLIESLHCSVWFLLCIYCRIVFQLLQNDKY